MKPISATVSCAACILLGQIAVAQVDPYEQYVKTSRDFQRVKQDKAWILKAWPEWTYMPWTWNWQIGYDDASGQWSREHGYNGAYLDHGRPTADGVDKLAWINKHKLRFYMDHTASKRYLHLWDGGEPGKDPAILDRLHGTGVRDKPVNDEMRKTLEEIITRYVGNVKSSPYRAAYALDDEISWGHFVHPTMWQITDDRRAYDAWLREVYGEKAAPKHEGWVSYEQLRTKLPDWSVKDFDCSQLMDQWTFNDSHWNNFLGGLVEHANRVDPATPCGYVGVQVPNAFGGYDYAKLMRKVQFLSGGIWSILRSLSPDNAIIQSRAHFHRDAPQDIWFFWSHLAQGGRGHIGWVDRWFEDGKPLPWHDKTAPHLLEIQNKVAPAIFGGTWVHDGVAIYYSHPSIQLGWILDAEAHGATWVNRNDDGRIGSWHLVHKAWENMLRDDGIQYDWIDYATVIREGIPTDEYKVLILPATICLSDAEARRIREFCQAGGTVIADYMPGMWDQHGRGRAGGGALDDIFGVKHDPAMKAGDVFGEKLWVEVDQDVNFYFDSYNQFLTRGNTAIRDKGGFYKAVRKMDTDHVQACGKGRAVLMNLSPQWYNAYRGAGLQRAAQREVFMKHVTAAGATPWVRIANADARTQGYEITYWQKDGRTVVLVVMNPETQTAWTGEINSVGLKTSPVEITVKFAAPVKDVRDVRSGKKLGDGDTFKTAWTMNEAVVLSFDGMPPRPAATQPASNGPATRPTAAAGH